MKDGGQRALRGTDGAVTAWVYRISAALLLALGALTAATGARTPVIWFKVCPYLLGGAAALMAIACLPQAAHHTDHRAA